MVRGARRGKGELPLLLLFAFHDRPLFNLITSLILHHQPKFLSASFQSYDVRCAFPSNRGEKKTLVISVCILSTVRLCCSRWPSMCSAPVPNHRPPAVVGKRADLIYSSYCIVNRNGNLPGLCDSVVYYSAMVSRRPGLVLLGWNREGEDRLKEWFVPLKVLLLLYIYRKAANGYKKEK